MSLSPGTHLGPYEILTMLGAGGMGEVYRARDRRLDRDVALKVLPPTLAHDSVRLERFAREARAIASLNHPHIVVIYSTEEIDGIRFMTMELVEGRGLDTMIEGGGLPLHQFFALAIPLADAISAAHRKQITHRDLKPSNVMLSEDGRLKVLDFGLARMARPDTPTQAEATATQMLLTSEGAVLGTMPYMSPEQITGDPVDVRTDVFSLGVMLYEMLAGTRPFAGVSPPQLMAAILRDTPTSLAALRQDVPAALGRLIDGCLEKRPEHRLGSARHIYEELCRIQQQGTDAPSVGRPPASVAVLPFEDLSAGQDQAWFCDGIAEDVLNALAQVQGIRTIARGSSFALRAKFDDVREIGRALAVAHVLTGSVRRAGGQVRVTAQLIATATGEQLWSERFDRGLTDLFAIQDEIAGSIVRSLTGRLVPAADIRRARPALPAYEALLRGRHELYSVFSPDSWQRAKAQFERAIALDPTIAEPHAQLGLGYFVSGMHGLQPMNDVAATARAEVGRALALDPSDPVPRFVLGAISIAFDYDWVSAEAHFLAALPAPHVPAEAHWLYASLYLGASGRFSEAVAEMRRAVEKDPLNANWRAIWGAHLINAGRPEEAATEAARAVELDAGNWAAHHVLGEALLALGRVDEATAALESAVRVSPWNTRSALVLAAVRARHGDEAGAAVTATAISGQGQPWGHAQYHLMLGELDAAADWYERMIDAHDPFALVYANAPLLRPLHQHPRWARIASRLNLPTQTTRQPTSGAARRSVPVAVVDFSSRSGDENARMLAEGLGDEVRAGLSRFPYVSVLDPRTASPRYKLESVVRSSGSAVRVVAHLRDTVDGGDIWSETYTRNLSDQDVFAVQDELADCIVASIADPHGVLIRSVVTAVRNSPIEELAPGELVLRYWAYDYQHSPAEHAQLRDAVEQAIFVHPTDAELWAVASRLAVQEFIFAFDPRPDPLGRALGAARRAVELDPAGQFGWEALALAAFFSRDREGFDAAAERSMRLNPRNANTLAWMGTLFAHLGDTDRGLEIVRRAMAINPQHPGWYYFAVWLHHAARGEWLEALHAAKNLNMPAHVFEPVVTAQACVALGRMDEARAAFARFRSLAPAMASSREATLAHVEKWAWATGKAAQTVELLFQAETPPPPGDQG